MLKTFHTFQTQVDLSQRHSEEFSYPSAKLYKLCHFQARYRRNRVLQKMQEGFKAQDFKKHTGLLVYTLHAKTIVRYSFTQWVHSLQEGIAAVLGVCFRLLADTKNSDSVLSTAIATVRQVSSIQILYIGSHRDSLWNLPLLCYLILCPAAAFSSSSCWLIHLTITKTNLIFGLACMPTSPSFWGRVHHVGYLIDRGLYAWAVQHWAEICGRSSTFGPQGLYYLTPPIITSTTILSISAY